MALGLFRKLLLLNSVKKSFIVKALLFSPVTTTTANIINPYEIQVNVTDQNNTNAIGEINAIVTNQSGYVVGSGVLENGTGYISATVPFTGNESITTSNQFYHSLTVLGSIVLHIPNINASLVLNSNASIGVSPYVVDVTIQDEQGNLAMGPLQVYATYYNDQNISVGTPYVTIYNGTGTITLPRYTTDSHVFSKNNAFYTLSSTPTIYPTYNRTDMMQTMGSKTIDPVTNAKYLIIANYTRYSGAFDYNTTTGNYTMNSNDECNLYDKGSYAVGYCIEDYAPPIISQQELDSHQFDSTIIKIQKISENGHFKIFNLTKLEFFDLWLGMKLAPCYSNATPPDPSYFDQFNSLATNMSIYINTTQTEFNNGGSNEQSFISELQGGLNSTEQLGFPVPVTTSLLQGLIDLANLFIQVFFDVATGNWSGFLSDIGNAIGVDVPMISWDRVLQPFLGPAVEALKGFVNVGLNLVVSALINPILSTDILNKNPTIFIPMNSTTSSNIKNDLADLTSIVTSGFSSSLETFSKTNIIPGFDISFPFGGIIGDLLKLSGPYILQTIFSEVANIIVSKVFIKVLGIDNLSITQSDFENLIQSLSGFSLNQIQEMFNIDFNQAFNEPTLVSNLVNNFISKINLSTYDYSNSSSAINTNGGLGEKFKATLNIGESFRNSLVSLMGINTNTNTNNARENTKTAVELEFVWYMVSDMMSQIIDIAKSSVPDTHETPYAFVTIELANSFWSVYLYIQGYVIKKQINELASGYIIGTISELEGLSNLWIDILTPIADFFDLVLYDKITSYKLKFFADLVKIYYSVQEFFSSIDDFFNGDTIFGDIYDFMTIIKNAFSLISLINNIIDSITYGFKLDELSDSLQLIKNTLPDENEISQIIIFLDSVQLFTGLFYIVQL